MGPDVTESFNVHLLLPKITMEAQPGVQELGPQLCRLSLSSDNKNTALGARHAARGYSTLLDMHKTPDPIPSRGKQLNGNGTQTFLRRGLTSNSAKFQTH